MAGIEPASEKSNRPNVYKLSPTIWSFNSLCPAELGQLENESMPTEVGPLALAIDIARGHAVIYVAHNPPEQRTVG